MREQKRLKQKYGTLKSIHGEIMRKHKFNAESYKIKVERQEGS